MKALLSSAAGTALAGALLAGTALTASAAPAPAPQAAQIEAWRSSLSALTLPANGCFKANFPDRGWTRVACVKAPDRPYAAPAIPRHATSAISAAGSQTVGNGNDYQAVVTHVISQGVGSFPSVTGVTSERDGTANTYSLQLNSDFFSNSPTCNGAATPSSCLAWQQFVYSTSSRAAFMQYWLIDYVNKCPTGWTKYSTDCYRNSAAVSVPKITIKNLANLSVTGTAVNGGSDKMVLLNGSTAYTTTGNDSVVYLANGWTGAEYNVIGDGNGSGATFNTGSHITVKIALTDGLTTAPTCQANDGTTGETNNLTLGACTASGGSVPSVTFTESN